MLNGFLISLLIAHPLFGATWSVIKGGGGDFETIQGAVDAAEDGDLILVSPGVYTSTTEQVFETHGKSLTIQSTEGSETTFIHGQGVRRGILCDMGELTIEGFTITHCTAQPELYSATYGGGLLCEGQTVATFSHCVFSNNMAPAYEDPDIGWFAGNGGAIACIAQSTLTLSDCSIDRNTAEPYDGNYSIESTGGGIYCSQESVIHLSDSTVTQNRASTGAGIYCVGSLTQQLLSIIENSTIANNSTFDVESRGGGGIMCVSGAIDRVSHCLIENNIASTGGGMRYRYKGANTLIEYCSIQNNEAINEGFGGGIRSDDAFEIGAEPSLFSNTFCANNPDSIWGKYHDLGENSEHEFCCDSDLNGDQYVGVDDVLTLVSYWDTNNIIADINNDGIVGADDLLQLIADWGACP
jgi:hypothetical protein